MDEIDIRNKIIVVGDDLAKPSDRPVMGDRRLVHMLPFGIRGDDAVSLPCIWISPYETFDPDLKENVKICILLLDKGPPKPEIVAVRIPSAAIHKFPMGPCEW